MKFTALLALSALLAHTAIAAPGDDWSRSDAFTRSGGTLHNGEARGQSLVRTPAPDGKEGSRLTWNFNQFKFAEVNLPEQPQFADFEELEIILDYYSEGLRQLESCGLRLADATGEVFQWSVPANDHAPGWKQIRHTLTPHNFNGSWGGNKDRKIDFPVRLIGFAAGFGRESAGPIWFGTFRYRLPGTVPGISVMDYRWLFDDHAERWNSWGAGRMNDGVIANVRQGEINLKERMFGVVEFRNCQELRFDYTLQSGSADLSLFVYDGNKKRIELPAIGLKPEKNTAVIPLSSITPPVKLDLLRVNGRSLQYRIEAEALSLWVLRPASEALHVAVETGHPLHLVLPDSGQKAELVLTNRAEQPLALAGEFTVTDYFGAPANFREELRLKPGESRRLALDESMSPKQGIYFVNYRFRDLDREGDEGTSGKINFARMTPAGPNPDPARGFLFSICTHTERWGKRDQALEVLASALAGAKVIRTSPPWHEVQPARDKWNFTLFDSMVEMYAAAGMELQPCFAFCAPWAKSADAKLRSGEPDNLTNGRSMPDLELWREYVRHTAERYRGKIRFWEVWNEPDLPHFANFGVEDYSKLMTATYDELKRSVPEVKVMTGGFAGLTSPAQIEYHRRFLEQSHGKFDIHAFHQHGDFNVFRQVIDETFLPQRRKSNTTVPWYANETALHSLGDQEQLQAETLFTKLIFAWARGAVGYTWYDLRNDGFSTTDAEHNYGMMTNDFYPKAVYPAYAALVNVYRDMEFLEELPLAAGEYAFLFRDSRTLALAAWREVAAADAESGLYAGTTDGAQAETVDIMGNRTPLPLRNGKFLWQPGRIPETVLIHGGTVLSFKPVLRTRTIGPAAEGRTFQLEFELENPFESELALNILLTLPAPLRSAVSRFTLTAAAGEKSVKQIAITAGKGLSADASVPYRIPVKVMIPDGGEAEILQPVYPARQLKSSLRGKSPDFILDKRTQVTSLYDKVPGRSIWQGPHDLSAQVSCGIDGDEFIVRAEVTDDIHRQNFSGPEIWKGDSVQIYLSLPTLGNDWEFGGALIEPAQCKKWVWRTPSGVDPGEVRSAMKLTARRVKNITSYEFRLPLAKIGLTPEILRNGFRFNLLVNDSDVAEDEREGWIRIAPGAGDERKPSRFPMIFFE